MFLVTLVFVIQKRKIDNDKVNKEINEGIYIGWGVSIGFCILIYLLRSMFKKQIGLSILYIIVINFIVNDTLKDALSKVSTAFAANHKEILNTTKQVIDILAKLIPLIMALALANKTK